MVVLLGIASENINCGFFIVFKGSLTSIAHADRYGRQSIVVTKTESSLSFANPGDIRIGLKVALQ